jgi:hypothetical protein
MRRDTAAVPAHHPEACLRISRRQDGENWKCGGKGRSGGFAKGLRRVWRGKGAAPELLDMLDWAVRQATRQAAKGVHFRPGRAFATLGVRHGSWSG